MFKNVLLAIFGLVLIGSTVFAQSNCYDADELASESIEIVSEYAPGVLEIDATCDAIIKIGYKYIGKAPVYIKIKDNCVDGQIIPIIAEPGEEYKEKGSLKAQRSEFVCASCVPVKIHFDLESGLRTFSYFENPKVCVQECNEQFPCVD
ncbi:MAG: hypothetical protein GY858_01425 [Candidatus Omnitrophica bacterium]|nr:hypothetical protein [Candidatus Omnitrophota bacterium]